MSMHDPVVGQIFAGLRVAAMLFWGQILLRAVAMPLQVAPASAPLAVRRLQALAWAGNALAVAICFSPAQIMAILMAQGRMTLDHGWLERLLVGIGLVGINVSAQAFLAAQARLDGEPPTQWRINIALILALVAATVWIWPNV